MRYAGQGVYFSFFHLFTVDNEVKFTRRRFARTCELHTLVLHVVVSNLKVGVYSCGSIRGAC